MTTFRFLAGAAGSFATLTFAVGCWCSPHIHGAPSTPPDEQFQTGTHHGYDLFVWHCVSGEHVVIWTASGEMFCGMARLERAACRSKTPIEARIAGEARRPIHEW